MSTSVSTAKEHTTIEAVRLEEVKTKEQRNLFHDLWKNNRLWKRNGYETNEFKGKSYQYLLEDEFGFFSTFEAINYNPDLNNLEKTSTVEDVFAFSELDIIKKNWGNIVEIDKLTVRQDKAGIKRMKLALTGVGMHCERHKRELAVALIEPRLFKLMKDIFKMDIYSPTGGAIVHNGYETVPTILLIGKMSAEKEKHKRWFLEEEMQYIK